jgi:MFS transporter, DHA1 family, multidrug resistance protein
MCFGADDLGLHHQQFIQGLAGATGIAISRAAVRDLYSGPQMTRFFALLMLINGVPPILAPILGGQILQFTSWRGVFVVLTGIGVIMLLTVFWGLRETLPLNLRASGNLKNTWHTFSDLFRNRLFMGCALSQEFVSAARFAYISGSPFVIQNIFGVSPQMFSAKNAGSASALIGLLSFILGGFMTPLVGIAGSHNALPMGITIAATETAAVLCYFLLVRARSVKQTNC